MKRTEVVLFSHSVHFAKSSYRRLRTSTQSQHTASRLRVFAHHLIGMLIASYFEQNEIFDGDLWCFY